MIVVNFSTKHHMKGQRRLQESLASSGVQFLGFTDYKEIGSPTHEQSPYEFKVHSIRKALQINPIVLWADSSMFLKGDIGRIESLIENDGYYMEEAGHYVRDWCNADTLRYFGINRNSPYLMFSAGLLGLNGNSPLAMEWLNLWERAAKDGHFKGSWKDHRHDMTCGSIIAQQMGMRYQRGGSHLAYIGGGYPSPEDGVVFHCQGI